MRHIKRLPIPKILADKHDEWQAKYEEKLVTDPNARPDGSKYGHIGIRDMLNRCSFNKCFYCESKLTGSLREIDHFIEVSIDHSKAYDWNNLYLSCSNCNDKINHNAIPVTEVLNPCVDSDEVIQKHITFEKECICSCSGSERGLKTIQKFKLDSELLDLRRSKWLNKLTTKVIDINNQMIAEHRTEYTEDEKKSIRLFMQSDQPYSLMCEIYIREHIACAL